MICLLLRCNLHTIKCICFSCTVCCILVHFLNCATLPQSNFRKLYITLKGTLCLLSTTYHFSPQYWATNNLFSSSVHFKKWNHTIHVLSCLLSLSTISTRFMHVVTCITTLFLYICICSCGFKHDFNTFFFYQK